MAIYQLLFFGSSLNLHGASGYIWGHYFWSKQDLDLLSTSKWQSEPHFCERWTYGKKRPEKVVQRSFIKGYSFRNSLYVTFSRHFFLFNFDLRVTFSSNFSVFLKFFQSLTIFWVTSSYFNSSTVSPMCQLCRI